MTQRTDIHNTIYNIHARQTDIKARTRAEFRFRSGLGSGGIWAGTGFGLVPVDLAGTRPVSRFFSESVFKVAKRTVENRYSLKSKKCRNVTLKKI